MCQGGVAVVYDAEMNDEYSTTYYQAVIKEFEREREKGKEQEGL